MQFRKGDVVSIEGVVDFTAGSDMYFDAGGRSMYINHDNPAIKLVRRRFQVGEDVRYGAEPGKSYRGKVIATNGEWLWIDQGEGYPPLSASADDCYLDEPKPLEAAGDAYLQPLINSIQRMSETFVNGLRVDPPKPEPRALGEVPPPTMEQAMYTLIEGDTLAGIANTFETSVDTIRALNDIPGVVTSPMPGTILKVPDNRIPF